MEKRWESLVAYNDVIEKYPDAKERETALFGAIVSCAEVNRPESARKLAEQYLKEFPKGPNVNTVGYLMGATALQANDPGAAETYFGRILEQQPNSSFKEEMRFQLANAKFAQGKYEEAINDYKRYRTEFASGSHIEDVTYRMAVGLVFAGKYEDAMAQLNKYIGQYSKGAYVADA